mmetsp:Transcript_6858/g.16817  ORF Transcript_6858/g.16817 Transcript_6858/m.16817 type:complete len:85 (+) Transcript_6858:1890-2144(+)
MSYDDRLPRRSSDFKGKDICAPACRESARLDGDVAHRHGEVRYEEEVGKVPRMGAEAVMTEGMWRGGGQSERWMEKKWEEGSGG